MTTWATIKNWVEFQHYKDRSPPWLKLHRKLLDDRSFQTLPIASKALAPMLWLLAAENMEGRIDISLDELVFRLRWSADDIQAGLPALIEKGFLIVDSNPLAPCQQLAVPETEGERETEGETEGTKPAPKRGKAKAPEPTLDEWLFSLGKQDAVPADDPLFEWTRKTGIPADWLRYAWAAFEDRYSGKPKTQADWRAAFRDHVKRGWLDVWRADRTGAFVLTTVGEQWRTHERPA